VWLASLMIVGTATRETQVLCLAYAAAWAGMHGRPIPWTRLLVMGVSFLAVYVSLRIGLGFSQAVASHRTFPWWLADPLALATIGSAGLLVWSLAAIQLTDGTAPRVRRGLIWLYVWSLPYLVMIAVVGLPRELRLIVPIALLQTMLAAQLRSESPGVANSGDVHHAVAPRQ
jgi:hypothetical protein